MSEADLEAAINASLQHRNSLKKARRSRVKGHDDSNSDGDDSEPHADVEASQAALIAALGTLDDNPEATPAIEELSAVDVESPLNNLDATSQRHQSLGGDELGSGVEPNTRPGISRQTSKQLPSKTKTGLETKRSEELRIAQKGTDLDFRDQLLDRREREFERRERELDRRERELERRERELERRQREFEQDKARTVIPSAPTAAQADNFGVPLLVKTLENLKREFAAEKKKADEERKRAEAREAELEARVMTKVNEVMEKERHTYYSFMRMSDNEVNDMVEDTVGYLMHKDEDIADRVRFQSLLHLCQEKLASEAGLQTQPGSESLALAWRFSLGPSVVTEDRYNKALELLKDKTLDPTTSKLIDDKKAMEYLVEYTSHLRKEGSEMGDSSFAPGRISKEAYMETVGRQGKQAGINHDALVALVDYICPASTEKETDGVNVSSPNREQEL